MKRIKMTVAYDGTEYCGWQIQDNGITVEESINKALKEVTKEDIRIIGASRTDSGVHARGNVAVFDTDSRIPAEKFAYALNERLPDDICITESVETDSDFHPRYSKSVKTYIYRIYNSRFPDPIYRRYSYFCYVPLDIERMQKAADYVVGEHDFSAFCSTGGQAKTSIRTVYSLDVDKKEKMISIKIRGNGFLYNMVRIIAGTLILAGKGVMEPDEMEDILKSCDRGKAGPTAPSCGLTLESIEYK